MSISLDPVVVRKLQQYSQRRRRLLMARGACTGLITAFLCFAAIGFVDWYWLVTDSTRWCLSGAAYLLVAIVVWGTSVRRLIHRPAQEFIAAQMEQGEPELHEKLLSAVELATDDPNSLDDSPTFRSLLQGEVAGYMGKVQITNLLPFKLVAKWAVAAILLVGITMFLLSSGDSRFRQLARRAFLPGANIARVSRIQVEILEPTPHSLVLAEDETVAVVVEISGGKVGEVTLETYTPNKGVVREAMRARTDTEFAANIHVVDESIEYRIFAGDAITKRYLIESRPRPRVKQFHKTYDYPEYSQLANLTVSEPHGDLIVLEDTSVTLILELDQEVSSAELRIDLEDSDEVKVVPLAHVTSDDSDKQLWQTTVPIDQSGVYKVHLVSSETGFDNLFSPKYEIRPQPDLIPLSGFVDQQYTTLLLPPNDILALKGMAEDDLPLVSLEQHVSVNGREWEVMPLELIATDDGEGRQVTANWQWDLLPHDLKSGDQIMTKLVATDRKGNTGESIPLRIVVAAPDFDPERHLVMERKLALHDEIEKFAILTEQQSASALEAIERLKNPESGEEEKSVSRIALLDLATKQRTQAEQLLAEIKAVESQMPAGADAYDLELTGRVVARLQGEHASTPVYKLTSMLHAENEQERTDDFNHLAQAFNRSADDAKNVATHYQLLASHNYLSALAVDFDALLKQQQLVVDSPTQTWERLHRQETVVVEQLEVLERLMHDHRTQLPRSIDDQIVGLLRWTEGYRTKFTESMESEDKLKQLQRVSQDFHRELVGKQRVDALDGNLPSRIISIRKDFENRSGTLYPILDQLGQACRQENRLVVMASESDDSVESSRLLNKAERYIAEVDLKQRQNMNQFRERKELTQARADADSQYAADAGLTLRAATFLLSQHRTVSVSESQIPEAFLEIAPAYRTLEAGHELILARDVLNILIRMERWNHQSLQAHIDHPRQWDLFQQTLELASRHLREAHVEGKLVQDADQVRWSQSVRDANEKLTQRRWNRDLIVGAAHELLEIRNDLNSVVTNLEPTMDDARKTIAKYAPTIPQMAQQAADQLRQLEEETIEAADQVENQKTPETQQVVTELEQKQEQVNDQIEDLFDALVVEANSQNLLDEEQLERARDADDSIAMIQEPAQQMNRKLEEAQQQQNNKQQAQELAHAAEQQEKTAEALEFVAEHFDKLKEGLDVADSREQLRQIEQDQGIARQMDQQFEASTELSELANKESQQLLSELEAELQRNPAMQQALSEISHDTLENAQNSLEKAAQDEENIQRANERADEQFQQKKKEIAEDLRETGNDISQLSRDLVEQAENTAAKGKTQEAQKKIERAQQKLNEAASKAQSAREDQLLADLEQTAQETKNALREATEVLKQAKNDTNKSKNEKIHQDDKQREAAKKDADNQRRSFHDRQKRAAQQDVQQAEAKKRNADQNVKNNENQVRNVERQVQQSQKRVNENPDNEGLKKQLAQQQAQKAAQEQKLANAKVTQQKAQNQINAAKQQQNEINRKPMPPLNAANPATQLSDEFTGEAIKISENLNRKVEELAKNANFQNELAPSQNNLASAIENQKNVTQDVQKTADDIARAARHERRLNNENAAQSIDQAAKNIEQVAQTEATQAGEKLAEATAEAEQAATNGQTQNRPNQKTQEAQNAVEASENAIAQQASQLSDVVEPLLETSETPTQPGDPQEDTAQSGPPQSFTPDELARGQQLAQLLDELDQQQATGSQSGEQPPSRLDSLAQAAQTQQATMAQSRQQQATAALSEKPTDSTGTPPETGPMKDFEVIAVNRDDKKKWGRLRSKSAEDVTKGTSATMSEEYRKSIETYFKVLAERARNNQ
ncbi:hypothetical protein OAK47_01610 [Planctomycetaceae bacterium]|nr:hypothetical protein [Planctomycetaceae bacterium]MDC0261898.1 hypothetical protein [Planctomycetaceae bacterium]MDC0273833.1 hypothetical protein [Planctomycetaceae bacterium]